MKIFSDIKAEEAGGARCGARAEVPGANRACDLVRTLMRTEVRAPGEGAGGGICSRLDGQRTLLARNQNQNPGPGISGVFISASAPRPSPPLKRGGEGAKGRPGRSDFGNRHIGAGGFVGVKSQLLAGGRARSGGFSLVEILLVTALLSLIVLALMSVFNTTQAAFRASITQTDVLEGSRATMDLLTSDFRQMVTSGGSMGTNRSLLLEPGFTVLPDNLPSGPVNFWLSGPAPTVEQGLMGTDPATNRMNQVQSVFILTKQADVWKGVGYFVDTNSTSYIYPLYRYDSSVMVGRPTPYQIFSNFCLNASSFNLPVSSTNVYVHHLLDGVFHFNVRAFDTNGVVLTNGFLLNQPYFVKNARFYNPVGGEVPMYMGSNTVPAAVEIQMGVMEDRILQRASSMPMRTVVQSNYLAQQAGKLHLFRQRVNIPNVDPSAYQQ